MIVKCKFSCIYYYNILIMFGFKAFGKGFAKNSFRSCFNSSTTKYNLANNLAYSNM